MISWIIILSGLLSSWYFTDLQSEPALTNTLCPLLVIAFSVALFIKFITTFGNSKNGGGGDGGSGGSFSDGGGFGDGGCGGGGD